MAAFDIVNGGNVNAGFNDQFKRQRTAGIPKSNYLVYVIPYIDAATGNDFANPKLIAGCQTLSGLEGRVEEKDFNASESLVTEKIAGKISHTNLTLTRGFDHDNFLRQWYLQRGNPGVGSASGISDKFLADIVIAKLQPDNVSVARLILVKSAWIVMYKADDMDVNSTDPWFESIEIAHKGWAYGLYQGVRNTMDPNTGNLITFSTLVLANTNGEPLIAPAVADYYFNTSDRTYYPIDVSNFFDKL
jgi:hypothetical protein